MALDYASLTSDVAALLAEFGVKVKVTRNGSALFTGTAVFTAITESEVTDDNTALTNLQAKFTRTAYITGSVAQPRVGDVLTYSGGTYRLTEVETTAPGGTAVVYKVTMS